MGDPKKESWEEARLYVFDKLNDVGLKIDTMRNELLDELRNFHKAFSRDQDKKINDLKEKIDEQKNEIGQNEAEIQQLKKYVFEKKGGGKTWHTVGIIVALLASVGSTVIKALS